MSEMQLKPDTAVDYEQLEKKAFRLMATARALTTLYEERKDVTAKYVHATSRGHEAVQLALGLQLKPQDYLSLYYRDDSVLLGLGMRPFELMLQLLAKKDDPFSGGRMYYSHPSLKREGFPTIPMQSSATGMQAIPAAGMALGLWYKEKAGLLSRSETDSPVVVCSLGDASVTEGEVAEALQIAALKQLPILFFVQDNEWDISASAKEIRAQDAFEYAKGFKGLHAKTIDGTDFLRSYKTIEDILKEIRRDRKPYLLHAKVPLLNHHTSGVRMEWYRDDLEEARLRDPYERMKKRMIIQGIGVNEIRAIEEEVNAFVLDEYNQALQSDDPAPADLFKHDYAPTDITEERGIRVPPGKEKTVMVDSALFAIRELMEQNPECLLYGQDVGARLGGVFREAATLARDFGDHRVFNTPIQEAFIIGSTVGMSAVGLKPIVEVQFADYIWPGLNQLFTEVSRSCYLSNGKFPVSCIIRVPIGAYGSGGPYHSSSVESVLLNIRGIKVAYPSTGADLKGLMKAAYHDPNPVLMLEHKGLYWSKIKGTEDAKTVEPDASYILPFGKGRVVLEASKEETERGRTAVVITYGMGVYWAQGAAKQFPGRVEVIDLRTLFPMDEELVFAAVRKHGKCLVLTEEPSLNSFGQALAGRIQHACFERLDAAVAVLGSENLPAIPLNSTLEATMLPNAEKTAKAISSLLKN